MIRPTSVILAVALTSCSAYRAVDEALDAWPRYDIPGSKASVALPMAPVFADETFATRLCDDLVRTSFSVHAKFGQYSGYFVALQPHCSANPSNAAALELLVAPQAGPEWQPVAWRQVNSINGHPGHETRFRRLANPLMIRTVQTFIIDAGVLAVVAEGKDNIIAAEDAQKFFRWVNTR